MRYVSYVNIARLLVLLAAGSVSVSGVLADENGAGRVTVSGISSGGHAAVQMHVALSKTISGAAVVAGGPYHCAEGNLLNALGRCISGAALEAAPLVEAARAAAIAGTIDPVESLSDDRVWLFHGKADHVVQSGVMDALREFYAAFLPEQAIALVDDIPASHGWPTLDKGIACGEMGADYINACDYDAAGELLQQLYGALNPPTEALEANLQVLDQTSIVADGGYFADSGFAYVPESCVEKKGECRLHVTFHGCRQGKEFIEDRFARMSGLNEWAESNRIIVLYPQVDKSLMNPQGCWDWWGYTGADYDLRSGKQVAGISALIEAWSGQDHQSKP
jgi:poly(3-hydroxybutyrate) depolymerase